MRPLFYWVLPILGFNPMMILTMGSLATIYGFWTHTEHINKLGIFEWIIVTPSHHRVHHGKDKEYIDHNYANMFIIWDRLFGTFAPEGKPVTYGITNNINTFNVFKIAFHEWLALLNDLSLAKKFSTAINYWFRPPGWQPNILDTKSS
jgi:sterol desaturase/sphingolipid hydroxylase (fatty acid hydroxylase superfamily)